MSPSSGRLQPSRTLRRRRRKRKESKVPVIGWIVLAACLLVLLTIPFLGSTRRFSDNDRPVNKTRDLVISTSSRDPACSCIRGVLKNASSKVFNEVQIYFRIKDKNGFDLGTVLAMTGIVRPHSNVEFYSDRMPPSAESYILLEIK